MLRRILIIASGGAVGAAMLALVSVRVGTIFGVGAQLDAYFVAVSLPSLLLSLSSSIVVAVLVPRLSALEAVIARRRAGEWALLAFLLATLLAGLITLGSHFIVTALAPGLSTRSADLASRVLPAPVYDECPGHRSRVLDRYTDPTSRRLSSLRCPY
jgi:hypothetical protein